MINPIAKEKKVKEKKEATVVQLKQFRGILNSVSKQVGTVATAGAPCSEEDQQWLDRLKASGRVAKVKGAGKAAFAKY